MYLEVGKIVGVWGVKGWLKLHSYTRQRLDIAVYERWYLSRQVPGSNVDLGANVDVESFIVSTCKAQSQGIVAKLQGIDDRDSALLLNGAKILVKKSDLAKLKQGEYYWHELIGLTVTDKQGQLGRVSSIIETGANDVLVVSHESSDDETLIPYSKQVVISVDVKKGEIVVDWDRDYL